MEFAAKLCKRTCVCKVDAEEMGNERMAQRRLGISRPGPQVRAAAAAAAEARRLVRLEGDRIRHARRRAKLAATAEALRSIPEGDGSNRMTERSLSRVSNKLADAINTELSLCPTLDCRRVVLEKLMNHITIWPQLPEYYPRPPEAKSQFVFLESFRTELQSVKTAHSKVFLARKGALLDAAVSEGCDGARALSRVLQVHPRNIRTAMGRRVGVDPVNQFALLERSKRVGLTEYVKEQVHLWWNQNTRVSPNKKDVTRKRIGPKEYVEHATQYLVDTQVCILLFPVDFLLLVFIWLLT